MKKTFAYGVLFVVTLVWRAACDTPVVVGVNDFEYAGSNAAVTLSDRVLVEGALRKTGEGALALPYAKISSLSGTIGVFDGALTTVCDGTYELAGTPSGILQKAAFWVDAGSNVVTFVSNEVTYVQQWLDVREPNPDGPYQYVRAVGQTTFTNVFPEYAASGAGAGGTLPYVWFGNYHSGRWMAWQNAASNATEISNIRNVFIVHGSFTSYGTILGSSAADFLAGMTGGTGLNGPIWYTGSHTMMAATKTGRTFLDRQRVDGMAVYPKQAYQLLEVAGGEGGTSKAGNFFNERNLWAGFDYRVGGDRLCEVLIYTNRLSEAERLQVEQYLWQKWISAAQDTPRFSLAEGASLSVESDAGVTRPMELSGDGVLVKDGAGTLMAALTTNTLPFNGAVTLASGVLAARVPLALQPVGGTAYASLSNVLTTASTNAGQIVKTGGGELVLRSIPDGVSRLSVAEGILQIAQPLAAETCPTNPAGVIPNSRFEDYAFSGNAASILQTGTAGWTSDANGRVYLFKDNVQTNGWFDWIRPYTAPEGHTVLGLQREAVAETTLTLPTDGVYAFSFWAAGRVNGTATNGVTLSYNTGAVGHEFDLIVDATQRVATVQTLSPDFQRFRYKLPWLTAGTHTLRFESLAPTIDYTSLLDDMRADFLTAKKPLNVLSNADFECAGFMNKATEIVAPSNTTWTFTVAGSNLVGIANIGSVYSAWSDYGRRVLYIENQGAASTTMMFPDAGTYQLVFKIMHRRTVSTESTSSEPVAVAVNGTTVATLSTTAQNMFSKVTTSPFKVAANSPVTLTLTGQASNNRVQLIDDLAVQRVGDDNLIQNGSFENGTNGWVCTGLNVGVETTTNANYGVVLFDGASRARVVFSGVIKQAVAFSEAGAYRLVFHAISRVDRNSGAPNVSAWGLNPIAAWIARNGTTNTIGYIKTYDEIFRRHEFLFTIPEAGSYEIGFQGQSATDKTSLIDAVSVEKVSLSTLGAVMPKTTVVDVATDARLNLNYEGTVAVSTVLYGGRVLEGMISAQTHPEFASGAGTIYSSPKGTLIRVQ